MASARNIIPQSASGQFPGCALSCATLLSAQQVCIPPYQAASSQLTYDTCFCNSAFLTPFLSTSESVCVAECPIQTDRQLLQAWYNGFCAQVKQGIDPIASTPTASAGSNPINTATGTSAVNSAVVTSTNQPSASSGSSATQPQTQKSWIDNHWKYVLMIVLIVVILALLALLGVWLKKRYRRKIAKERAAASGFRYDPEKRPENPQSPATTGLWGPHQMMHATRGYDYAPDLVEAHSSRNKSIRKNSGKQRRSETGKKLEKGVLEQDLHYSKAGSRRARPSELENNANMIGIADRRSKSRGTEKRAIDESSNVVALNPPVREITSNAGSKPDEKM